VIEPAVIKYLQRRTTCARLGIARPEDDESKPRLHNGACAHRTRLDCNIQSAAVQAVVPQLFGGPAQSKDFGVSGGVVEMDGTVVGTRHHTPVLGNNRSHRNFSFVQATLRLTQSQGHKLQHLGPIKPHHRRVGHTGILSCHATVQERPACDRRPAQCEGGNLNLERAVIADSASLRDTTALDKASRQWSKIARGHRAARHWSFQRIDRGKLRREGALARGVPGPILSGATRWSTGGTACRLSQNQAFGKSHLSRREERSCRCRQHIGTAGSQRRSARTVNSRLPTNYLRVIKAEVN